MGAGAVKRLILKRASELSTSKNYRIRYEEELNPAQLEAVMHGDGPALIVAGAGTGKTRTLTYRVARLVEDGVAPESISLLTFTRKSATEMLRRAASLLDGRCERVSGGTFHSFAHRTLRRYAVLAGFQPNFTVLDQSDMQDAISLLRGQLGIEKNKRRFPQKQTIGSIYSMAINRCTPIATIIKNLYPQFENDSDKIIEVLRRYQAYKHEHNAMDYDDLLVFLLTLLQESQDARMKIQRGIRYLMVDEYQDTNQLQHRIVLALANEQKNVLAVGDDAQSIYSFRGADFNNIFEFGKSFDNCVTIKIEENYRSVQPILDLSNEIIDRSSHRFDKKLWTRKVGGELPYLVSTESDRQQSLFVVQQVLEHRELGISFNSQAVLVRSGFLSFDLEIELNRANIPFRKFGGLKFSETAHVKDLLAYARIIVNPRDALAWNRVLLLEDGVGPKTAADVVEKVMTGELDFRNLGSSEQGKKNGERVSLLFTALRLADEKRNRVGESLVSLAYFYKDRLQKRHDDWAKRWKDIEVFLTIAERYETYDSFLIDMALEPPTDSIVDLEEDNNETEYLTISTIHSAKGLEWNTVYLLWALEGRFPSPKSVGSIEQLDEERRLFYVATTRAKEHLFITYPTNVFDRETGFVLGQPTRFLDGITGEKIDRCILQNEEQATVPHSPIALSS